MATPFCDTFITFTIIRFLMGLTYDITIQTFYLLGKSNSVMLLLRPDLVTQ